MGDGPGSDQLDGQSVQTLVNEILQRIIHKAVTLDSADPMEQGRSDAHPHVCPLKAVIGTHMPGVRCAFIDDAKFGGGQAFGQALVDLRTERKDWGVHSLLASSLGK
jgi:hypothetical protein